MSQDLIKEIDFVTKFFFFLTGCNPSREEEVVFNAVLILTFLKLSPKHSEAVVSAMKVFKQISDNGEDIERSAQDLADACLVNKEVMFGFGHSTYKEFDPRVKTLFKVARKNNLNIKYMNIAKQLEHSLEDVFNKKLILNIDGAIAALLLTFGVNPDKGQDIFRILK